MKRVLCFIVVTLSWFSISSHTIHSEEERKNVQFQVVDEQQKGIPDAEFALYQYGVLLNPDIVSDQNGTVLVSNLSYGEYTIQQKKTKYIYEIEHKSFVFQIDETSSTTLVLDKVINKKIKANVNLKLRMQEKESPAGIEINILNEKKELIERVKPDKDGNILVKDLPIGLYYIEQATKKEEWKLDVEHVEFEVTKANYNMNYVLSITFHKVAKENKNYTIYVFPAIILSTLTISIAYLYHRYRFYSVSELLEKIKS